MSRLEKLVYEGDPTVYAPHTRSCWRRCVRPGSVVEFRTGNNYYLGRIGGEASQRFLGEHLFYPVETYGPEGKGYTTEWCLESPYFYLVGPHARSWALRTEADWIMAVLNGGYRKSLGDPGKARPRSPYRARKARAGA